MRENHSVLVLYLVNAVEFILTTREGLNISPPIAKWKTNNRNKGDTMIARIWHGQTTPAKADAYMEDYFDKTGLADYQATQGNLGVLVLRRDGGGEAEFLMITLWESEDAIKAFTGDDINQARYYPKDNFYFAKLEPNVAHYDVVVNVMKSANS